MLCELNGDEVTRLHWRHFGQKIWGLIAVSLCPFLFSLSVVQRPLINLGGLMTWLGDPPSWLMTWLEDLLCFQQKIKVLRYHICMTASFVLF